MKKQLLLIVLLVSFMAGNAQVSKQENEAALELVKLNARAIGLSASDLDNLTVSGTYLNGDAGIRMVYLQQSYRSIPVFNQMCVLAFRKSQLVSSTGSFIQYIDQLVNIQNAIAQTSAEQAVAAALTDRSLTARGIITPVSTDGVKKVFGKLGVSTVDITTELVWLPVSDKEVRLAWQVELAPVKTPDHFLIRIDAATNQVLDKNNYTVHEHFEPVHKNISESGDHLAVESTRSATVSDIHGDGPAAVDGATYRVVPYPAESPNHPGGAASLVTDPWTNAPGNATSLKWHYDGTTYHDSTRGNNVWAQEDRDANNNTFGKTSLSTTAQPNLTLDYTPNYTLAPTTTVNQQFAVNNLFYWNNIVHDITYLYGFNEPSGNFQASNQGRGGVGNDYVIADAQDAAGTNNANFSTPTDGNRPRMQMYLFTSVTPNRDGDLDNGIIAHEYGHGVSNRLTGGPANTSCLSNAEQGGEGWSDYLALMTTTNWATATVNDGALAKPIGTYALAQATTGAGIRTYPYSTNMSINPWTYAMLAGTGGQVHTIGEIWCTALWEMTWELIAIDGINPNIFNPAATGGNSAALKLVIEGMKLQPCSPGYIDARNAILKADTLFFGAKYSCAIWKAFAKRGMGTFASQGSSNSTTDQVADFTNNGAITLRLTQSVTQQQEGLNITYTNRVSAGGCGAVSNHTLRDTLPANVTYISGGNYDAGTRVVSFPVNLGVGQSQDYSFTVKVNPGSYYAPVLLIDEPVAGTTIPASWTTSSTTSTNWAVSSVQSTSAPNSLFSLNLTTTSDQKIETANSLTLPAVPPMLTFQGYINSEVSWDGGVVEISTNNGSTWTDLGPNMITGGYNGTLNNSGTNPLKGRAAFTSNSGGFIKTTINLSSFGGQNIKLRFRFGSDGSVASTGWYIDDILLKDIASVNMRSSLFNNNNIRVAFSDTSTIILPGVTCTTGSIGTQPASVALCEGKNASFNVIASGTDLTYQWQVSTNGGVTFADIPGAITSTLNLNAVSNSMNNNQYHCVINGTCTVNLTSDNVLLTVNANPASPLAGNGAICGNGAVVISASPADGETINWYEDASGTILLQQGTLTYTTPFINSTAAYYAFAVNSTTGCSSVTGTLVTATVNTIPNAPGGANASSCGIGQVTISASAGVGEEIDWYASSTGGPALVNNSFTFTTGTISSSEVYYAEARNTATGCISASRTAVTAIINQIPTAPSGNNGLSCSPGSVGISAIPGAGETIDWYDAASSGALLSASSASYVTATISSTTVYYAEARNISTGCISATRTPVIAKIGASSSSTTAISICSDQLPYTWNGNLYTAGGTYSLILENSSGCDSVATLLLDVVATLNVYSMTGGGSYTSGGVGVPVGLSGSQPGISYQLILNGSINAGLPVTGTGNAISFGNQLLQGQYSVIAAQGVLCPQNMSGNVTVTITAALPVVFTVTGGGTYCQGTSGILIGLSGSETGVSYQLKRSNGNINVGLPVAGTGAPLSFGSQLTADTYTVVATNTTNLLTRSMLNSVFVRIAGIRNPSSPGAITGIVDACPLIGQGSTVYTISQAANATSYIWSVPAGASIIGSNTDTTITVQYNSLFVSGNISVQSVNACFNNAISTARLLAIRKNVPATPGGITASSVNPCSIVGTGGTVNYTIRKIAFATSYNWTVTAGMNIVSNLGDTGIVVSFNTGFTTGTVAVSALNNCATSAIRSLAVKATVPGVPISISGPLNICSYIGQPTTATYTIAAVAGAASYLWTTPANSTIVSGQGTTSVEVSFASNFVGGSLTVKSVAACGSSAARSFTFVKNVAQPGAITASALPCPLSTVTYSIAAVPFATSYLWSVPTNATYVSGQGTTSFTVTYKSTFVSGTLTVKSINNCSTSAVSSLAVAASACNPPLRATESIYVSAKPGVYPNPNNGVFTFSLNEVEQVNNYIRVYLLNMYGNKVLEQRVPVQKNKMVAVRIDASNIPSGLYEFRYLINDKMNSIKVIIVK